MSVIPRMQQRERQPGTLGRRQTLPGIVVGPSYLMHGKSPRKNKSVFASFFSKKEESSFSEEKEAKRLLFPAPFTDSQHSRLMAAAAKAAVDTA
jgi:hypothetical protein